MPIITDERIKGLVERLNKFQGADFTLQQTISENGTLIVWQLFDKGKPIFAKPRLHVSVFWFLKGMLYEKGVPDA